MVISKSGIHCLFELHIICLPPPPVYSQQCVRAGCALVCLNLLGVFFSVGCVCFSFKKVLFPNTLCYERNALKKSFQSHPGLIFNITGMCLVIVIVKWWRCSALQLCTCLISYFPTWQKMGRPQKACNQCRWKTLGMWFCFWLRHLNLCLCLWTCYPSFHYTSRDLQWTRLLVPFEIL